MSTSDEEIRTRYSIHKTLNEMLHDRGYIVSDLELNMTKEQFKDWNKKTIQTAKRDDNSDQIIVFLRKKLDFNTVVEKERLLESDGVSRAIFVVRDKVSQMANKRMNTSTKVHFEVFQETELLINVTKHHLVPQHQLLTDEEKEILLEKYNLSENKMPKIQVTDPIARYIGMKRGQVVKITRPSETAGKYITYRCAV